MATWATVRRPAALTPSQGAADACASRPVKRTSKWPTARQVPSSRSVGPGVDHHRGVDAVEGAALEHEHLAAAALLGRGAEHAHGEPEVVGHARPAPGRRRRRWPR